MKKSLQIDENKAFDLYQTATPEFKQMLEDSFGKEFFKRKITDRVKSYEDACAILGIDPHTSMPDTSDCPKEDRKAYVAFHKLVVITRALNEGWRPDWSNTNQPKWFNWWWTKVMRASPMRTRLTPPRLRVRASGLAFALRAKRWPTTPLRPSRNSTKTTSCSNNRKTFKILQQ